ncbi:MAG TPA: hypothetical protein VGB54_01450 [Allosphingosinicella sp.]|jgi:hypothetical protein
MEIALQPAETRIDTWTIFYLPPNGGKCNGKLTVTNQRLLYEAKFDATLIGVLGDRAAEGFLQIDKGDIRDVEVKKSFFSKKAVVTLTDGSQHVFDYGAMNIDKCAEAIQAR